MEKQMIIEIIKQHHNDEKYYMEVLGRLEMEFDFFYSNIAIFNIRYLIDYCKLCPEIVAYIIDNELDDLDYVIKKQQLSDETIDMILQIDNKLHDEHRVHEIQEYQRISCKLIQKHKAVLDMKLISEYQYMDCRFLIDNRENLHWSDIMLNTRMAPVLNEGFIALFAETNLWDNIAYSGIPLSITTQYGKYFTDKSFIGYEEINEISKDEILKMIEEHDQKIQKHIQNMKENEKKSE